MKNKSSVSLKKVHEHDEDEDDVDFEASRSDHEDGPIWVNDFNESSARNFTKQIQRQSNQNPQAPIIVYIDSGGGEVYALLTMISAIDSVPNKVITVALGKAMSAGAMLLAYGDLRYASPHANIMIHEMSAGTVGHIDDIHTQHSNLHNLNEYIMKMLAKSIKIKGGYPALKKTLATRRDLYLSPDQAVKFGVVDHIGIPMLGRSVSVDFFVSTTNKNKDKVDEPRKAESKRKTSTNGK